MVAQDTAVAERPSNVLSQSGSVSGSDGLATGGPTGNKLTGPQSVGGSTRLSYVCTGSEAAGKPLAPPERMTNFEVYELLQKRNALRHLRIINDQRACVARKAAEFHNDAHMRSLAAAALHCAGDDVSVFGVPQPGGAGKVLHAVEERSGGMGRLADAVRQQHPGSEATNNIGWKNAIQSVRATLKQDPENGKAHIVSAAVNGFVDAIFLALKRDRRLVGESDRFQEGEGEEGGDADNDAGSSTGVPQGETGDSANSHADSAGGAAQERMDSDGQGRVSGAEGEEVGATGAGNGNGPLGDVDESFKVLEATEAVTFTTNELHRLRRSLRYRKRMMGVYSRLAKELDAIGERIRHREMVETELLGYLNQTAASQASRADMKNVLQALKTFGLSAKDMLHVVNTRPTAPVEVETCVRQCTTWTEEARDELCRCIVENLPPAPPDAARDLDVYRYCETSA